MAFTYGFFNSYKGDRKYDAEQFSSIFDGILKDGIVPSYGQLFDVNTANNGMQVTVGTGRAWFHHTWSLNDSIMILNVPMSDITRDRYDAVVLEVNHEEDVRANSIKIISGVPEVNTKKPILINNSKVHQYPLAYILVKAGSETIPAKNIENMVGRDPTVFATGILETVAIDDLWSQWEGEWREWFEAIKLVLTTDVVTNLQYQIDKNKEEIHNISEKVKFIKLETQTYTRTFTEDATWVNPESSSIDLFVRVVGGGGFAGNGGAGSGYMKTGTYKIDPGKQVSIVIGKGATSTSAPNGGTTSFGTYISASGGEGTLPLDEGGNGRGGNGYAGGGGGNPGYSTSVSSKPNGNGGNGDGGGGGGGSSIVASKVSSTVWGSTTGNGGSGGTYGGGGGGGGFACTIVFSDSSAINTIISGGTGGIGGTYGSKGGAGGAAGRNNGVSEVNDGSKGTAGYNTNNNSNLDFKGSGSAGLAGSKSELLVANTYHLASGGGGGGGGYGGNGGNGGNGRTSTGYQQSFASAGGGGGGGGYGARGGNGEHYGGGGGGYGGMGGDSEIIQGSDDNVHNPNVEYYNAGYSGQGYGAGGGFRGGGGGGYGTIPASVKLKTSGNDGICIINWTVTKVTVDTSVS